MNQCTFLGKLKSFSVETENNIERVELILQIENKRKGKNEVKKMDYEYLSFEAWGTAAISIYKNLTDEDFLLVIDSTARRNKDKVCFRINEFKIIKKGS
jgi:hypothetical protein